MFRARCIIAITLVLSPSVNAHEPDLTRLPLGDERISNAAKAGWIWACRRDAGGGGAHVRGPWIKDDGTFDLTQKTVVDGAVLWPHQFNVSIVNGARVFTTNDLPRHPSGVFPIAPSDDAYLIDRNPNRIQNQDIRIALPLKPALAPQPSCAPGAVGILLTGVVLFNALDAMGRDAVAHEIQDGCQGHPELTGTYHYHSVTSCLADVRLKGGHSALVGYAVDGFGIYGRYGEGGRPLASADLDDCHGHTHRIEWDGALVEIYHYHASSDFPYTVGCLRGVYDLGAVRAISGPPQSMTRDEGRPDLEAAATKLGIGLEKLRRALGPPPPDLAAAASRLGITELELSQALGIR